MHCLQKSSYKEKLLKNRRGLKEQGDRLLGNSEIRVNQKVFADVKVQFGDTSWIVPNDLEEVLIVLGKEGVTHRPAPKSED